jgi:hypothetical protein
VVRIQAGSALQPPSPQLAAWLRQRVLGLRKATRNRVFTSVLEVVPTAPELASAAPLARWPEAELADTYGLRVEVLLRLLDQVDRSQLQRPEVALVRVRPGPTELCDSDLAWWAAALGTHGIAEPEVVRAVSLTRWGWLDVVSAQQRTWNRLRA